MAILKPNKPLKYVKPDGTTQSEYPLTSIDQVIDEDGIHRLNQTIVRADLSDVEEGQVVLTNSDLLENHPASYFATSEGLGTKANKSDVKDLQDKTRINYLRPTLQTQTVNGVTITNNGDGTYTLNGTATSSKAEFKLFVGGIPKGKYKILMFDENEQNVSGTTIYGWSNLAKSYVLKSGKEIELNETKTETLYVSVETGITVSNLVIKPMLTEDLNATYVDFVSYDDNLVKVKDVVLNARNLSSGSDYESIARTFWNSITPFTPAMAVVSASGFKMVFGYTYTQDTNPQWACAIVMDVFNTCTYCLVYNGTYSETNLK